MPGYIHITVTSYWARWRLKSSGARLFTQPFIQAQIKENIKAPRHWPLSPVTGEIPAKGPTTLKMFLFDSHHEKLYESFMQSPSLMRHKFYVPNQQPNATKSFISSLQAEKLILKNDNPLLNLMVKLYVDMHYWNTNDWIVRNTLKWVLNCNTTTFYIRKNTNWKCRLQKQVNSTAH